MSDLSPVESKIDRHKTALTRYELSRPISLAIDNGVIRQDSTIFDYGCGKGSDLSYLNELGFNATGWDPHYAPKKEILESEIVNLGYVINVIENPSERKKTVIKAYNLAKKCLVISAQVLNESNQAKGVSFNDGTLTQRNTFQKYFDQLELKTYIETTLDKEAIPASLGIFFVFKCEQEKQDYLAQRSTRKYTPRVRKNVTTEERIKKYEDLLQTFVYKIEELGRVPKASEFPLTHELRKALGPFKLCAQLAESYYDNFSIEDAANKVRDDLLVYLALTHFSSIPKRLDLSIHLLSSIEELLGGFRNALKEAKKILFKVGDPHTVSRKCFESKVGKLLPDDLYIHIGEKDTLHPILRIYIGCAELYVGEIEGANVIKIHRKSKKVSFLTYKDFDKDPHPQLMKSTRVDFLKLKIQTRHYDKSSNRPILHRKELFVSESYKHFRKFERLTEAEEAAGLFEDTRTIGYANQWQDLLDHKGLTYKGHRLIKK